MRVEKVPPPAGSLVAQAFPRLDYADAYRARLPGSGPHALDEIARVAFGSAPRWVTLLLRLRNDIVKPLGLKTGLQRPRRESAELSLQPGDRLGLFTIFQRSERELLMGEDDRHLDFRVSLLLQPDALGCWAVVSTVVRFNGWLGHAYFLPVRPLHQLIVPALIRNGLRHLEEVTR
jgi:hypothetical protein